MVHFWNDGFPCRLDPRKRKFIEVEREQSNANSMILSHNDIRTAVNERRIVFDTPLVCDQFKEASVDLRLGFPFTILQKDLHDVKISVANGLKPIRDANFSRTIDLKEKNALGQAETFTIEPKMFVLAMTHEKVTVPRDMIAMVEGRSTYARVGLSMHQTAPWIQPDFEGQITLEIMNNGPLQIELTPLYDLPCQLTFFQLSSPVPKTESYGSRETDVYQWQKHPFRRLQKQIPN